MELDSILNGERLSGISATNSFLSILNNKLNSCGTQIVTYATLAIQLIDFEKKDPYAMLRPGNPDFIGPVICDARKLYHEIMNMEGPVTPRKSYSRLAPVVPFTDSQKPAA